MNTSDHSLRIEKEFNCSRQRLWRAWTDPEQLVRWFGPDHAPASNVVADVRPGGAWRACLDAKENGGSLWVSGHFEEVVANTRLVFSFRWEGDEHEDGPGVDTWVTVEFIKLDPKRTRLVLIQTGLVSTQSAEGHTEGWSSCLERLARAIDRLEHDPPSSLETATRNRSR